VLSLFQSERHFFLLIILHFQLLHKFEQLNQKEIILTSQYLRVHFVDNVSQELRIELKDLHVDQ